MFCPLCRFQNGLSAVLTSSCALRVHLSLQHCRNSNSFVDQPRRTTYNRSDLLGLREKMLAQVDGGSSRRSQQICLFLIHCEVCILCNSPGARSRYWKRPQWIDNSCNIISFAWLFGEFLSPMALLNPLSHCASSRMVEITNNTLVYTATWVMHMYAGLHHAAWSIWTWLTKKCTWHITTIIRCIWGQCVCLMHTTCKPRRWTSHWSTGQWASRKLKSLDKPTLLQFPQAETADCHLISPDINCEQLPCWRL